MLAVMTYAEEFLVCAVMGMVIGRYLFVDVEGGDCAGTGGGLALGVGGAIHGIVRGASVEGVDLGHNRRSISVPVAHVDGTWGGGDPCCGVDEEEEDENYEVNHEVESVNLVEDPSLDIREPLLASLSDSAADFPDLVPGNTRVLRRSAVGNSGL